MSIVLMCLVWGTCSFTNTSKSYESFNIVQELKLLQLASNISLENIKFFERMTVLKSKQDQERILFGTLMYSVNGALKDLQDIIQEKGLKVQDHDQYSCYNSATRQLMALSKNAMDKIQPCVNDYEKSLTEILEPANNISYAINAVQHKIDSILQGCQDSDNDTCTEDKVNDVAQDLAILEININTNIIHSQSVYGDAVKRSRRCHGLVAARLRNEIQELKSSTEICAKWAETSKS